jgi:hypothetical protein
MAMQVFAVAVAMEVHIEGQAQSGGIIRSGCH